MAYPVGVRLLIQASMLPNGSFDPLIMNNPERTISNIPPGMSLAITTRRIYRRRVDRSSIHSSIRTINGTVAFTKVLSRHTIKVRIRTVLLSFDRKRRRPYRCGLDQSRRRFQRTAGTIQRRADGSPLAELMMGSSNFFQWGNWNITPYGWNQAAYVDGRLEGEQQTDRPDGTSLGP